MDSYGYDCYFEADTGEAEEGTDYYHAPTQHNYNARPDSEWADTPRNKLFVDYIEKKGYHVDFEHALIELIKENGAVTRGDRSERKRRIH